MPCSCFGKKDKKTGPLKNEGEKYRPRDGQERAPPVSADSGLTTSAAEAKKHHQQQQQQQQLLGSSPPAPVTPPSTPSGDVRLRPEDDADKATRRRDVVASFYSDQCELIGFKPTGSRPPSAHVGHHDGPAATSSPATSSPSSTRSAGACCRADLAEKRREFFKDLANDDSFSGGSRPISRLTDPGSQQTPRHSHYQEQLHHTLPYHSKANIRSNKVSTHPLVLQQGIHRNSTPGSSSTSEEKQPLLLHSSPSPEQAPKIKHVSPDVSVSKFPNHSSNEVVSDCILYDDMSDETPLLSDNEERPQVIPETKVPTTVQKLPDEISQNSVDQAPPKAAHIAMESKSPELLVDISSPTEVMVNKVEVKASDPTEFLENARTPFDKPRINNPEVICEMLVSENSKLAESTSDLKTPVYVVDVTTSQSPQLTLGSCNGRQEVGMDVPAPESELFTNNEYKSEDLTHVVDNSHIVFSSENFNPFAEFGTPGSVVEPYSGEHFVSHDSHQFDHEFSYESQPQTLIIDNEALKEPHFEGGPQTIVETTRQFISASSEIPIHQKNSQTIVETTRQFITRPPEEQTTKTLVETTHQFLSENPDEPKSSQSIVETTRHYISSIPEDEESKMLLEDASQQVLSGMPVRQVNLKTTENFISGSPNEQITHAIVQTTQHLVSGSPNEQQILESSQEMFPSSNGNFFLTSVEELEDVPEKLIMQTGTTVVTTTSTATEKPVAPPRTRLTDLPEEEPKLPDVPCFGAPPPPATPPSPLIEGKFVEESVASPVTSFIAFGEEETLPSAPPIPNAEQGALQSTPSVLEENRQSVEFAFDMPSLENIQQQLLPSAPSPPPPFLENEQLPPTLITPLREDSKLPTPPTPPTGEKREETALSTSICTTTTISSTPGVTCGVEIVSSSTLEDDGIGSEIDDALESIEGLSEEGNTIGRAAAASS